MYINGMNVRELPEGLGEGTFRVETVYVEDANELALQRKIREVAHQRRCHTVLVGEMKRRKVPPADRYVARVPEQTYCRVVFAAEPVD